MVQLFFRNSNDMFVVRRELLPIVEKNMAALDAIDAYAEVINGDADVEMGYADEDGEGGFIAKASRVIGGSSPGDLIIDIREYDIPYYLRVAIDKGKSLMSGLSDASSDLSCRNSSRTVVYRIVRKWGDQLKVHTRASGASRTCGDGLRYRDYESAPQISCPRARSDHDDFVHD